MPRLSEVAAYRLWIGERAGSHSPFGSRDPRSRAVQFVHRDGEGSAVRVGVVLDHRLEAEALRLRARDGHADEAARFRYHEIDILRTAEVRRHDEVAFVLAVLVVGDDYHFSGFYIGYRLFYSIEHPLPPNSVPAILA